MQAFRRISLIVAGMLAVATPVLADINLLAGGGFQFPKTDNTTLKQEQGYRGMLGLQAVGENLGLTIHGGYARFDSRGTRGGDALSRQDTRLFELYVLPKFYLTTGDVSAYFTGGGGPQWTRREVRPGDGSASFTQSWRDVGFLFGFGVEVAIADGAALGAGPSYHMVYWNGRREFEYAAFMLYLRI